MKGERLFHLVDPDAWRAFETAGEDELRVASLESEGFVHLSFRGQLDGTLEAHFAGTERLVLLELDATGVAADVRLELSRGGERFPHLYRPLRRRDVVSARAIERAAEGWTLPD